MELDKMTTRRTIVVKSKKILYVLMSLDLNRLFEIFFVAS